MLSKIFSPLKYAPWHATALILRWVFFWIMWVAVSYIIKFILDSLWHGDRNSFLTWFWIIIVFFVLRDSLSYHSRKTTVVFEKIIQSSLYNLYLGKYFLIDNNIVEIQWTWKMNSILQRGVDHWVQIVTNLQNYSSLLIWTLGSFIVFWITLWLWLGIVIMVFLLVTTSISIYANRKVIPYRTKQRELFTTWDRMIVKMIMSKYEVLQNFRQERELSAIKNVFIDLIENAKIIAFKTIWSYDILRIAIDVARLSALFYLAYGVSRWIFSLWDLALCWMLFNSVQNNMDQAEQIVTKYYSSKIYIQNLRTTFEENNPIQGYEVGKDLIWNSWTITLCNLSFSYNASQEHGWKSALKNFSLSIPWGKKLALVGRSGSWKSTIMKLIAGYLQAQDGYIEVDWQRLPHTGADCHKTIRLKDYYQHIWYVTQEPSVFDGTIYENLIYWINGNFTEDQINNAISLAKCEFIYDFPDQLQTEIWEKWIRLSGGQRQRLAIAKLFLKNPLLVLLDEPTAALDSISESHITIAFSNLFKGRTVVVIAHRLQTVKESDEIVVIDHGQIVQRWTHQELSQISWTYKDMLNLQSSFV